MPTSSAPGISAPSTAIQQLLHELTASLADTPYSVSMSPKRANDIDIHWNAVDQKWKALFQSHSIKIEQGLRVTVDEASHRYRINDQVIRHQTDAGIGVAGFGYQKSVRVDSGRLIQRSYHSSRSVGIVTNPDGRVDVAGSDFGTYTFTTTGMRTAVIAAMADAGWTGKPGLSSRARWGIVAACLGGLVALGGAAIAVMVATAG